MSTHSKARSLFTFAWCLLTFLRPAVSAVAAEGQGPTPLDGLRALEARMVKTASAVFPSVVGVNNSAGVIVSKDGLVLTAAHLGGLRRGKVTVRLSDGRTLPGKTLGMCGIADAAMLKIQAEGPFPFAMLGKAKDVKPGQWCLMFGHRHPQPPGRPAVLRVGHILEWDNGKLVSDCRGGQGDSGGPLFDLDGQLIGINSYGSSRMGHVPADFYKEHWEKLQRGERWGGRPRLVFTGEQLMRRRPPAPEWPRKPLVPLAARAAASTGQVLCGGKPRCLGTIVSANGLIATKASELTGAPRCRLHDGREFDAHLVGQNEAHDLAFLRVDADKLSPITWTGAKRAEIGRWVIVPGPDGRLLGAGIVTVAERSVPFRIAALGAHFAPDPGAQAKLSAIEKRSPAAKAALKVGDVIVAVNGQATPTLREVSDLVSKLSAGDKARLRVRRAPKELDIVVRLVATRRTGRVQVRGLGGPGGVRIITPRARPTRPSSRRQDGFPTAFQHGAGVAPSRCGAPLVGLAGKALGIHIASAPAASYALPAAVVVRELTALKEKRDAHGK